MSTTVPPTPVKSTRRHKKQRAVKSLAERFWEKVDRRSPGECWPWLAAKDEKGYGLLHTEDNSSTYRAHRVSAQFAGMSIQGLLVLHSCDNPGCVNPAHLRPGTHAENMRDMLRRKRQCRGSSRPDAKLTEADIPLIRAQLANGETNVAVAEAFGISASVISHIRNGRLWKHVP